MNPNHHINRWRRTCTRSFPLHWRHNGRDGVSNHQRRHWPIWGDRWIPRTKGQLRGKCFHLMTSLCGESLCSLGISAYGADAFVDRYSRPFMTCHYREYGKHKCIFVMEDGCLCVCVCWGWGGGGVCVCVCVWGGGGSVSMGQKMTIVDTRWRHDTDTLTTLLTFGEGNPLVTGGFSLIKGQQCGAYMFLLLLLTSAIWWTISQVIGDLRRHDITVAVSWVNKN